MSQELAEEQLIKRYFLGDLPESEQDRIQERMFNDYDFFEALQIIEGELVDDYALGLTSELERSKLERGLLTSRRECLKVNVVKILDQYITSNEPGSSSGVYNLSAAQKKTDEDLWECLLSEAHANRNLILSLIEDDWLGLELLLQLKTVPRATLPDLVSLVERDEPAVTAALVRLSDCDLVRQHEGRYSYAEMGDEVLEKLQNITDRSGL